MDKRQTVWKSCLVATVPPSLCLVICIKTQLAHGKPSKFNILSISYIGNKHKLKILCLIGTRSTLGSIVFHSLCVQLEIFGGWKLSLAAHALSTQPEGDSAKSHSTPAFPVK